MAVIVLDDFNIDASRRQVRRFKVVLLHVVVTPHSGVEVARDRAVGIRKRIDSRPATEVGTIHLPLEFVRRRGSHACIGTESGS